MAFKKRFSLFSQSGYDAYVSGATSPSAMDENMIKGYIMSTSPMDAAPINGISPHVTGTGGISGASRGNSRGTSPIPGSLPPQESFQTDMSRDDLHKNLKNLENVISALDEYRELAFKLTKASKRYCRALRDYAANKECETVYSMTISNASGYYDSYAEVEGKLAKALQKDYDILNNFADKHFRKVAKEERIHDDHVGSLDKQIKRAGGRYEQKARKKDRDAVEAHDKYISALSSMGSEIARAKREHQVSYAKRERYAAMMVAQSAARIAESDFSANGELLKRCGPHLGRVQEWAPFAEENMPPPPPDLRDSDDEDGPDCPETPQPEFQTDPEVLSPLSQLRYLPLPGSNQLKVAEVTAMPSIEQKPKVEENRNRTASRQASNLQAPTHPAEPQEAPSSALALQNLPLDLNHPYLRDQVREKEDALENVGRPRASSRPRVTTSAHSPVRDAEILDAEKKYWSDKTEGSSSSDASQYAPKESLTAADGKVHFDTLPKVERRQSVEPTYNTIPTTKRYQDTATTTYAHDARPQRITLEARLSAPDTRPLRRVSADASREVTEREDPRDSRPLRRVSVDSVHSMGSTVANLREKYSKMADTPPRDIPSVASSRGPREMPSTRVSEIASQYAMHETRDASIASGFSRDSSYDSKRLPYPPNTIIHSKYCACQQCRRPEEEVDRDPNGSLKRYERSMNVVSPRPMRVVDVQKL